jgi:predicted flap endonuclease-1-like 5' DNA nuclease
MGLHHTYAFPPNTIYGRNFEMRAFKVFIFGLLYGWFFKIAFDRIYHQNDIEDLQNENASLREYIHSLEVQVQPKSLETKSMQSIQRSAPRTLPAEAPAEREEMSARVPAQTSEKDDLKVIKGIGPAIERKLNNAGIQTFAALSQLKAADLENILGSQVKRLQDENDLIAQARKLARKK